MLISAATCEASSAIRTAPQSTTLSAMIYRSEVLNARAKSGAPISGDQNEVEPFSVQVESEFLTERVNEEPSSGSRIGTLRAMEIAVSMRAFVTRPSRRSMSRNIDFEGNAAMLRRCMRHGSLDGSRRSWPALKCAESSPGVIHNRTSPRNGGVGGVGVR